MDEQDFLENWHPNYYQCDDIAWLDDISKLLDGEAEEGDSASTGEYAKLTREELNMEYGRLMRKVLREAFENYLYINYPTEE